MKIPYTQLPILLVIPILLLGGLATLAGAGGGGDPDGVDILPQCVYAGGPTAPTYAAYNAPDSLLYDYLVGGGLPPSWPVGSPSGSWSLTVTAGPPTTNQFGCVCQPVLISGTINGNFVMSAATLVEDDGLLKVVGPRGTLGLTFVVERDLCGPLFYGLYAAFDPGELGDGNPIDDPCGQGTDGNGTGGIPTGPCGIVPLVY